MPRNCTINMIRTHRTRYLVSAIGISTSYEYVSSYVVRALVGPLFILLIKHYFLDEQWPKSGTPENR